MVVMGSRLASAVAGTTTATAAPARAALRPGFRARQHERYECRYRQRRSDRSWPTAIHGGYSMRQPLQRKTSRRVSLFPTACLAFPTGLDSCDVHRTEGGFRNEPDPR